MADKGPGPSPLIQKRITAEIARLNAMVESQELEMMETEERVNRIKENIAASKKEVAKQQANLEALLTGGGGDN